jgi:hypothetical protein
LKKELISHIVQGLSIGNIIEQSHRNTVVRCSIFRTIIFSVVSMVVADTNYRCLHVGIDNYGKDCDSTIFKRSQSTDKNSDKYAGITQWQTSCRNRRSWCTILLGRRWGICAKQKYTSTFCRSNLSVKNNVYKRPLCRAQNYVEYAFGILSNKWIIFQRKLNGNPAIAGGIVTASIFLHNFVRASVRKSRTLWQWLVLKMYLMEISTCGVKSEQCKE